MKQLQEAKAAAKLFLQQRKKRQPGPVRVGFLCQYIPGWNKAEPIYRAMAEDDRFEPVLLCVPSQIRDHQLVDPESTENDTYDYFTALGYPTVNTLTGKNQWLDLTALGLDFLFCQRPYDFYLPRCYHSGILAKHMKLCFVPYAILLTREELPVGFDPAFMRNVWCCFAETADLAKANRNFHRLSHLLGIQKSMGVGIVSMAQVLAEKDAPGEAWDFTQSDFRLMWTPRWTTDPALGGTNFFRYKDWLLDYGEANPSVACVLRPHPMAFDHFVEVGQMTREEVEAYQARIEALPNACLDTRKGYLDTMWRSDALIGDISSILPEYFAMDKPLIYCDSNMILTKTAFFQRMLEGCYVVQDQQQLEAVLAQLRRGEDPKKETRAQILRELFPDPADTVQTILDTIIQGVKR